MILPLYLRTPSEEESQQIMLVFSILDIENVTEYCDSLSSVLEAFNIGAAVFFSGEAAERYPKAVCSFGEDIDIGSQTYSYVNLTSIADYSIQLEEIRKGKEAVNKVGDLYSRLFRAPYAAVDENIYSLLSRNDIWADFSYNNQYNVYTDGQFVRHGAVVFDGASVSAGSILALGKTSQLLIIRFDSHSSIGFIADFIAVLKTGHFDFVSASEATGLELTIRGDYTDY